MRRSVYKKYILLMYTVMMKAYTCGSVTIVT